MATERFNRQFIMLDFEDLDNPDFMEFVRSPEFSTYLIMRRYVWRSSKPHSLRLHEYYANGVLACALSRDKIAEKLGGISARQITRDINSLVARGIVKSINTGRGNIFLLGKWATDPEEGVYYEYFFMDRLQIRVDTNVQSEETSESGQKRPPSMDTSVQPDEPPLSTNNIESNKERNKGSISKDSSSDSSNSTSESEEDVEVLESGELEMLIETCSREFDDLEHLESNLSRVFNLWARTPYSDTEMLAKVHEARRVTKSKISTGSVNDRSKKMAYCFAVLEDLLGLRG
jgi:hypothetical protein